MFTGKIVRFNKVRGFGFINNDEDDIFFFADSILNRDEYFIKDGLQVTFEIAPGYKGPQAVNVSIKDEEKEN
ncbi:cold-shock protein [Companilactobacillus nuruki]|uniref:DNA-binding protein n=1 Tax=Companilactobacillus nuruki TaxID=1993540 RepID=A0A2N7AQU7_9LACO|nr:cold shock domain-containing protein [Companilactobacillus nuruki]PMD67723.1 DNA-binding protein [Companilactobacillus nuruki]